MELKKRQEIEELISKVKKQVKNDYYVVNLFEQKILDLKDPKLCYYFASTLESANVRLHGKVVIDSENSELNYYFARGVKGADIKAHGQVVIDSKDPQWNYYFARDIEGADIKAHGQVVKESGSSSWNRLFALNVEGKNTKSTQQNNTVEQQIKELNNLLERTSHEEEKGTELVKKINIS